ncbi:MAG: hypothetical protein JWN63_3523, partial [Candidatus Acidoferrum typicum]|nr:hypothetical protein [Candidatus Acidoferrum typicum]
MARQQPVARRNYFEIFGYQSKKKLITRASLVDLTPFQANCFRSLQFRGGLRAAERDEVAEPVFAQVKSSPDEHAKNDWEVEGLTGSQVRNSCAAKIGCQQNGAEDRGRRNHIEDCAHEQDDTDGD